MEPFDIRDEKPEDAEIQEVVKGLKNDRVGGASKSGPNT